MSLQSVEAIHDQLSDANTNWPRFPFTLIEKRSSTLEKRLARAVGSAEIDFCISSVAQVAEGTIKYLATLFTPDLVISGTMMATDIQNVPSPLKGDVVIVPRSAIRSLTLHHVEYYGYDNNPGPDYVSFTATFAGAPDVVVGLPGSGLKNDGATSRLFDALQADLQGVLARN